MSTVTDSAQLRSSIVDELREEAIALFLRKLQAAEGVDEDKVKPWPRRAYETVLVGSSRAEEVLGMCYRGAELGLPSSMGYLITVSDRI